jgi:predicted dehydrogenase
MRTAVLGLGSIGARHLSNLRALGVEELYAYDPNPAASSLATKKGAIFYNEINALFANAPQLAVIAAPTAQHQPLALAAARHGCHLFIEKPLSHSPEGLDELEAALLAQGQFAMVACNMRFHPGPATARRLLHEGAIGRALSAQVSTGSYLPRWRPSSDYRASYSASPEHGGAVLDCIHELDLALWYLGPARLVASAVVPASAIDLPVEGLAEILLAHDSGAVSSVHLSFVSRDYHRRCRIEGEAGTLEWDFHRPEVLLYGPDGMLARRLEWSRDWEINDMYVDEMRHFLDCLRQGIAPPNPLPEARAALDIALAARKGARP